MIQIRKLLLQMIAPTGITIQEFQDLIKTRLAAMHKLKSPSIVNARRHALITNIKFGNPMDRSALNARVQEPQSQNAFPTQKGVVGIIP